MWIKLPNGLSGLGEWERCTEGFTCTLRDKEVAVFSVIVNSPSVYI